MKRVLRIIIAVALITVSGIVPTTTRANQALVSAMTEIGANVVFMRHALAPGFGDPVNFDVSDCTTQRNLDATGRAQAAQIGAALRTAKLQFAQILTSQWCRCRETAELMNIGPVTAFAGLNSFFQDYADRDTTLTLLRDHMQGVGQGPVLYVTHQVVITAITGQSVRSGELIAYNTQTGQARRLVID